MKLFAVSAAAFLIPAAAWSDTILSPDAGFVSVPLTYQSTTGTNSAPFWNNYSSDGMMMNGGDYLTGSNPSMGSTDYLGSAGAFGSYLSTGSSGPDAPADFSFLQSAASAQITLLYSDGLANAGPNGTEIGLYNLQDPTQKVVLFSHGSLYNPAANNGVYNNDLNPLPTSAVNTWADYGIYATTCGLDWKGVFCDTYYSNTELDQSSETARQHFAVFENPQSPQTFFIAFEDGRGWNPTEGAGDYNDVIFRIQTNSAPIITTDVVVTPEPATFSIIGLGLAGLGLLSRSRFKNRAANNS